MSRRLARPLYHLSGTTVLLLLLACGGPPADGQAAPADAPPAAATGTGGAAAQGDFEGVIHVTTFDDGESIDGVLRVKGARWRFETEMDGEQAVIVRGRDGRVFSIIHSQRQYAWFPQLSGDDEAMQFEATGATDRVAGYECTYHRIRDPDGVLDGDEVCVTAALGFVGVGPTGAATMLDDAAIRQQFRDGFMILKSRDSQGVVEYEVTRIERTAVGDDMFEPPAGYTELTAAGMEDGR
jgi:hypothetical protein